MNMISTFAYSNLKNDLQKDGDNLLPENKGKYNKHG
jgi:hypothetical protein